MVETCSDLGGVVPPRSKLWQWSGFHHSGFSCFTFGLFQTQTTAGTSETPGEDTSTRSDSCAVETPARQVPHEKMQKCDWQTCDLFPSEMCFVHYKAKKTKNLLSMLLSLFHLRTVSSFKNPQRQEFWAPCITCFPMGSCTSLGICCSFPLTPYPSW